MKSGVYQIQVGPYVYYGSSSRLTSRKSAHKRSLEKGTHGNRFMQRAYNRYGYFVFTVIRECSPEEAVKYEQELINRAWGCSALMNAASNAFNAFQSSETRKKTAERNSARIWTEESRRKLREKAVGRKIDVSNRRSFNGSDNPNAKLTGIQIKDLLVRRANGETINSLADFFNVNRTTITRICSKANVYHRPKSWSDAMRKSQIEATARNPKRYSRDVRGEKNPRHKATIDAALIAEYGRIRNL